MLAPQGGRVEPGRFLPDRIRCTSLGIFCTGSLFDCRICDRTLRPVKVGGPFPCQQRYSFNPARPSTAQLAGEMPPSREGDRYFWGCASAQQLLPAVFPPLRIKSAGIQFQGHEAWYLILWNQPVLKQHPAWLIYKTAHANVHYHAQRQEHE